MQHYAALIKHFMQQIIQHLVSRSIEDGDVSRPVQPGHFGSETSNLLCLDFSASRHWPKPIPATERNQDENALFASCTEKEQASNG